MNLKLIIIAVLCFFVFEKTKAQVNRNVINAGGISNQYSEGFLAFSVGESLIGTTVSNGATLTQGFLQTWKKPANHIAIKLFLEGLYAGSGTMNQAQGLAGAQFSNGISDLISVELHYATEPYALAYSFTNIPMLTTGKVDISEILEDITGKYYVVIKHRNSVETWSSVPVSFGTNSSISYDFSTSASKAYGNNMKAVAGGYFAIYGGNASVDGIIDGTDMSLIDNASATILRGYYPEDINGDGLVDASDMAVIDNNSMAVVHLMRP